jgi:hypothetical protein
MGAQILSATKGKRRVTSMLDKSDIAALEAIAQDRHVSLAWVIRDAVREYLAIDSLNEQHSKPRHSSNRPDA